MKAVILAGGSGTRLRPLTDTLPKPLVPVGGQPVLFSLLDSLRAAGATEAIITLRYRGEQIRTRCGEHCRGVTLRYYEETEPLGTAGALPLFADFLGDEPFLVLSGDVCMQTDLRKLLAFHREKDAEATLMLARAADPREYGVVLCDEQGRVTRFVEKPSWAQALTDAVNAGIYVLSPALLRLIPKGRPYDFSRDLFPRLLASGRALFAMVGEGSWCDIGDPAAYLAANLQHSGGRTVRGEGCSISDSASVQRSVLWDGVTVESGAVVREAILCDGVRVGAGAHIDPGCILCAGSQLKPGAILPPGSILPMGQVYPGEEEKTNRIRLTEGGLCQQGADALSCLQLGAAMAGALGNGGRIGVLCARSDGEKLAAQALLCGIAAAGGRGYDFGEGFESMAAFASSRLGMDLTACLRLQEDGSLSAALFDSCGLYPTRRFERALGAALRPGGESRLLPLLPGEYHGYETERCEQLPSLYRAALAQQIYALGCSSLRGLRIAVDGDGPVQLLRETLCECGAQEGDPGETGVLCLEIARGGDKLTASQREPNGERASADLWHIDALLAQEEIEQGRLRTLVLPFSAPAGLEKLTEGKQVRLLRYTECPADESENVLRSKAAAQSWLRDGCFAALRLAALLTEGETLAARLKKLPPFWQSRGEVPTEAGYKTLIMRTLGHPDREGVCLDYGSSGRVRIIPASEDALRIIADAHHAEAADELIALSDRKLRQLLRQAAQGKLPRPSR